MKRKLLWATLTLSLVIAWTVLVFMAINEGWLRSPLVTSNTPAAFIEAVDDVVKMDPGGNLSMYLIEDGKTVERLFRSSGAAVDGASVYQVASLGKWITAYGVMVLAQDGAIDLDRPVSDYLTRWQLPASEFDPSGVTVRRLLSHTAGLSDQLGYDGFESPDDVQSLEGSLDRALDASPGKDGRVRQGLAPGSEWLYSGGGYTILQLMIEELSQQPFADFMSERVFKPLAMTRTTFSYAEALKLGLVENFRPDGSTEPFRWYTALGATSLFTTADDLAIFMAANSASGTRSVLSQEMLSLMRTPHAQQFGADIWGLGTMLFAPNNQGGFIIGHDGSNGPGINTAARLDPDTGDGIVILSTGSETRATELASEWVFWKTGNVDSLMFLMSFNSMLLWIAVGAIFIVATSLVLAVKRRVRNDD